MSIMITLSCTGYAPSATTPVGWDRCLIQDYIVWLNFSLNSTAKLRLFGLQKKDRKPFLLPV